MNLLLLQRTFRWARRTTTDLVCVLGALGVLVPFVSSAAEVPTYLDEVAPLLERHCEECHREGDVAPMALGTYQQARPWARSIARAVEARDMPPWFADPTIGRFRNDRRLSDEEVATIVAWARAGAPRGGESAAVGELASEAHDPASTLGPPSRIFEMPEAFTVPATGVVEYHYVRLPMRLEEDQWVRAVQVVPGARDAVHHIDVMVCSAGCPADPQLAALPDGVITPLAGGSITTKPRPRKRAGIDGDDSLQFLTSFLPGGRPSVLPPNYAWLLPKGSDLYFNLHYTPNGEERDDRSRVALWFADEPPQKRVTSVFLDNFSIWIPAGDADYEVETRATLASEAELLALTPHMHSRGKAAEVSLRSRGRNRSEALLRVPRYDFNWQITYELQQTRRLQPGDQLRYTLRWDNSRDNPFNPDPERDVPWGRQTSDEMAAVFVTLATKVEVQPEDLFAD